MKSGKNNTDVEINLSEQHEAIANEFKLGDKFEKFIKGQTQDYNLDGTKKQNFSEYSRNDIITHFKLICESYGVSLGKLILDGKIKEKSKASKLTKRLNYFLRDYSTIIGIDSKHPIQVFSYHKGPDKISQVCFHLSCARTETTSRNRTYSVDNITFSAALQKGKQKKQEENDTRMLEQTDNKRIIKLLHAVPLDPNFVGRRKEIELLNDAWDSHRIHFASVIAWGGFGKSVLVRQWLEEINYSSSRTRKPEKVFWWSFYQNNSVEAFLETAITCLNLNKKFKTPPHIEEGLDILISLLGRSRSILVLDGFEDLQYSQAGDYFGKCKSYQLANFIRRICEGDCQTCLCVVTSRIPITDIISFKNKSHISINIESSPLHVKESRSLLRKHGLKGHNNYLDEIVKEHGGHPLALVTIATLLSNFFMGDVKKYQEMPSVAIVESSIGDRFKLWRTFSWYDSLLNDVEKYILRVISLFRQVAPWELLISFIQKNKTIEMDGFSKEISETELKAITFHLNQLQLIRFDADSDTFSMHPLWKTFFEHSINDVDSKRYHRLLFEILQAEASFQPDTLFQMWPLIESVYHGCRCNCAKAAINIFRERIERKSGYLTKNLAAWETKIDLCSMFFTHRNFHNQCLLDNLEEQGHLLNATGFAYMNIGLPVKAVSLFDRAAKVYTDACLENDEGQVQRNRAEAFLRIGNLEEAVNAAKKALKLDLSSKYQQSSLGYLGYAYALMNSSDLAESAFNKAISLFGQDWLPPIRGVQLVEMLIMKGQYKDAIIKTRKMLKWARAQKVLYHEAECLRIHAIALSEIAILTRDYKTAQKAVKLIRNAVNLINQAGVHYYIVRTVLNFAHISLSLTIENLNALEESDLKHITRQIFGALKTSKESCYRLLEAEGFYAKTITYFLTNNPTRAHKELSRALKLARHLKYRWLVNKCIQLQNNS